MSQRDEPGIGMVEVDTLSSAVAAARAVWRDFLTGPHTRARLIEAHTRNKFLILAHSESHYRRLGRLVGTAAQAELESVIARYQAELDQALACKATGGSHANALQHLLGMCNGLGAAERAELHALILAYRQGRAPLSAPRALLRDHARRLGHDYVLCQTYLQ